MVENGKTERTRGPTRPGARWPARVLRFPLLWAGIVLLFSPVLAGWAQTPAPSDRELTESERDSLLREVRRYTEMIASLRDSLADARDEEWLDEETGEEVLDRALEQLGGAISNLGTELSELDLQIDDQTPAATALADLLLALGEAPCVQHGGQAYRGRADADTPCPAGRFRRWRHRGHSARMLSGWRIADSRWSEG